MINQVPNIFNKFFILLIKIYQYFISPLIGQNCRFIPSCSNYAIEIINKNGFFYGVPLILKRLLRCHPFGSYGFDPPTSKLINKINKIEIINLNIRTVRNIRKKVLYKNLLKKFVFYEEDKLKNTRHFGLRKKNQIISILSIIEKDFVFEKKFKSLQIRGMGTLDEFQKKGYGSLLLKKVIELIKEEGNYDLIWCNSRKKIMPFYLNNFFTPIGDEFIINEIGKHKILYLKIKNDKTF